MSRSARRAQNRNLMQIYEASKISWRIERGFACGGNEEALYIIFLLHPRKKNTIGDKILLWEKWKLPFKHENGLKNWGILPEDKKESIFCPEPSKVNVLKNNTTF